MIHQVVTQIAHLVRLRLPELVRALVDPAVKFNGHLEFKA